MVILKFPERIKASFRQYVGIDYSGAETPESSLKGIRAYQAGRESLPVEVDPPPSPRRYWTRRGLAEWLAGRLAEDVPNLVGTDHGFSSPLRYFEVHWLEPDWRTFLDDFQKHWPTDVEHTYVDFIRGGSRGEGEARSGSARWRRITEERAGATMKQGLLLPMMLFCRQGPQIKRRNRTAGRVPLPEPVELLLGEILQPVQIHHAAPDGQIPPTDNVRSA